MKFRILFFALIFAGASFSMSAQTQTPHVTKTQVQQHKRIKQGVRSGELTKKEAVGLHQQQKSIHRNKKLAKADGKVTRRERKRLNRMQKRSSANIYRQKHDSQNRK